MSRLTDFYRGVGTDSGGRTLDQVWAFSDDEMESHHDFIQWLFPLRESSRFNPDAPTLSDADIAAFRDDPRMRQALLRSFEVFLAFLGLSYDGRRVTPAPNFDQKRAVWGSPNHNWLRITRVLASTRRLGLEDQSRALFDFLNLYRERGRLNITPETFQYWENAAGARTA